MHPRASLTRRTTLALVVFGVSGCSIGKAPGPSQPSPTVMTTNPDAEAAASVLGRLDGVIASADTAPASGTHRAWHEAVRALAQAHRDSLAKALGGEGSATGAAPGGTGDAARDVRKLQKAIVAAAIETTDGNFAALLASMNAAWEQQLWLRGRGRK